jgi:hypothetical protein
MSEPSTAEFEVRGSVSDATDELVEEFEEWLASAPDSVNIERASLGDHEIQPSQLKGGFVFKMERGWGRKSSEDP